MLVLLRWTPSFGQLLTLIIVFMLFSSNSTSIYSLVHLLNCFCGWLDLSMILHFQYKHARSLFIYSLLINIMINIWLKYRVREAM